MGYINYNGLIGTQESEVKRMSPKVGRPKSDNPKSNDIKVRIDNITHQKLIQYCKANNQTKAEVIRQGIELVLSQNKK